MIRNEYYWCSAGYFNTNQFLIIFAGVFFLAKKVGFSRIASKAISSSHLGICRSPPLSLFFFLSRSFFSFFLLLLISALPSFYPSLFQFLLAPYSLSLLLSAILSLSVFIFPRFFPLLSRFCPASVTLLSRPASVLSVLLNHFNEFHCIEPDGCIQVEMFAGNSDAFACYSFKWYPSTWGNTKEISYFSHIPMVFLQPIVVVDSHFRKHSFQSY